MDLVLHIGHYKTGSTAIQTFFDSHRKAYLRKGWLYPAGGAPTNAKVNQSAVAFQALHEAGRKSAIWYEETEAFHRYIVGTAEPALDQVVAEVEEAHPSTLLLSSEEFVRFGGRRGVPAASTKALLSEFAPRRTRVVCLLRRPDRYLESFYNQQVKLGRAPKRLSAGLGRYLGSIHVQYGQALSYWVDEIGIDRLCVLRYDEIRADLIPAFIESIGASSEPWDSGNQRAVMTNPRLPDAFVEFTRRHNKEHGGAGIRRIRQRAAELATDEEIASTPVYLLDAEARRRLLEIFRPIDRQLAELTGSGGTFFPDLEDMAEIPAGAISDIEAFERWGPLMERALHEAGETAQRVDRGRR